MRALQFSWYGNCCGNRIDSARSRGSQYVSIRYSERLAEAGIEPSVGSTGDSYDNALADTINGLFKAEVVHRRGPWKTREAVELATLEWVSWFNHHRLLEPIGYIPQSKPRQTTGASKPKPPPRTSLPRRQREQQRLESAEKMPLGACRQDYLSPHRLVV